MLVIINWVKLHNAYSSSAVNGASSRLRYVISKFNAVLTYQEQQMQDCWETEGIKGVCTQDLTKRIA